MKNIVSSQSFARPADTTAYASGDLVANSTTAGSVSPLRFNVDGDVKGGNFRLLRARILKSGTSITNAAFRAHFYGAPPTVTNGDNGVWLSSQASYLGSVDVTVDKAFSDGAAGVAAFGAGAGILGFFKGSKTQVFVLLEARGSYTPASAEVFTVVIEGDAD